MTKINLLLSSTSKNYGSTQTGGGLDLNSNNNLNISSNEHRARASYCLLMGKGIWEFAKSFGMGGDAFLNLIPQLIESCCCSKKLSCKEKSYKLGKRLISPAIFAAGVIAMSFFRAGGGSPGYSAFFYLATSLGASFFDKIISAGIDPKLSPFGNAFLREAANNFNCDRVSPEEVEMDYTENLTY